MATAGASALALAACGGGESGEASADSSAPAEETGAAEPSDRETTEAAGPSARVALTYDGGVLVYDAADLEQLADLPAEGFTRLNQGGDNRHLFLTEGESFRMLDTGTWTEPHGDHGHSYTTEPILSEQRLEGPHPGHLVVHDGRAVAFFDGSADTLEFDPTTLDAAAPIETTEGSAGEAHHGVAVPRADGSTVLTEGTEDARSTVRVVDADGEEIARTDECPGVHGEAAAADGVIVVGCEDGIVIVDGEEIRKVDAADDYARIGNQAGSPESPVVLGDYKTDPDAELERPQKISLTDTEAGSIRVVDLPASYSFRGLGRGPEGEALVFGTDGTLRVIDPESGEISKEIPVTEAWEEPDEWQQPMPNLQVSGSKAYITEPEAKTLHVVDLESGEVADSVELPEAPIEMAVASGDMVESHGEDSHDGHDHGDDEHGHDHSHDHEGHDHGEDGHDHDHGDDHSHEGHDH